MTKKDIDCQHSEARDIVRFLEENLGQVRRILPVRDGLVHHVFRVEAVGRTAYVKVRANRFAALPDLFCDPGDICYEKDAIVLLSGLEPDVFPQLIAFDEKRSMILMTDVRTEHRSLRALLDYGLATPEIAQLIGETVGRVHQCRRAPRNVEIQAVAGLEAVSSPQAGRTVTVPQLSDPTSPRKALTVSLGSGSNSKIAHRGKSGAVMSTHPQTQLAAWLAT